MKTKATTVLLGVGAVAAMVLLPRGAHAQPGGDGGGPPDSGADMPGSVTTSDTAGTEVPSTLPPTSSTLTSDATMVDGSDGGPTDGGPPDGGGSDGDGGPADGTGGAPEEDTGSLVECAEDGSSAHYDEFLSGEAATMERWAGTNTGCSNTVTYPINTFSAVETPSNESIPAYPMLLENNGTTDLSQAAHNIGIMLNGVAMFGPWATGDNVETYEMTAFYLEGDTFDLCGGHSTPDFAYHYHNLAGCLQEQAGGAVGEHSPQIGWAYDGFPFCGQLGPNGIEMKTCGLEGADPDVCLDACSGYAGAIDQDDFVYRYYTSCGFDESFYPFTAICFRGCCPEGMRHVEACGDDPVIGYTDDHVPVASTPLDEQYDATLIDGDDLNYINSNFSVEYMASNFSMDCSLYLGSGGGSADVATVNSTDSIDPSGASKAYSYYAGMVLSGAITAAAAVSLSFST